MSVYKKLNEARAKFHALKLEKTGNNKFAGYMYFELGDFLIPALHVFQEVGLCAVVSFDKDAAQMLIVDIEAAPNAQDSSILLRSPMPANFDPPKGMQQIQHIGSCETYQRRYLWMAALEIVEHDAIDALKPEKKDGISTDFKASGPEEAFKALQPEVQALLRKAAPKIDAAMNISVDEVMTRYQWVLDNYDESDRNDVAAGLSYLLDSKTRSAIKAYQKQ
jgi:hypothetical protein